MNHTHVEISIVVPAYNGDRTIADCLESIQRATQGRLAEIIVVDSSEDKTAAIVQEHFPDVLLIRSHQRLSAGGARNRGIVAARGQFIFFTDQDCVVPPDWIDRLQRHLRDATVDAAGGAVGIRNLANASGCAVYFLEFLNHFPRRRRPQRNRKFLIGCNGAYRADVIRAVCFPDQTIAEDILLSNELRNRGFTIVYDPRIEVLHQNREGWKEFFEYNRKMGRAAADYHAVIQLWWAAPVLRHPNLVFFAPFVVLPSIAWDLLQSHPSYLLRFLVLAPACLVGNLVWAKSFRQRVLEKLRTSSPSPPSANQNMAQPPNANTTVIR
jgi:cellulose synthase/poly-beta-1,6-N-acetylglucosamine synthase-like glycosyltransferase